MTSTTLKSPALKKNEVIAELFDYAAILENYSCENGDPETHRDVMHRLGKRINQLGIILANEEDFRDLSKL